IAQPNSDPAEEANQRMTALAIALVIVGAALASLGVLRMTHAAFTAMPASVGIVIAGAGAAVVVFGAVIPHLAPRHQPAITLQREPADATPEPAPHTDLHGVVSSTKGRPVGGAKVVLYSS